jgi:UDP-glucose:(heptosyl)LPS alpha-1,3-glucosyltransferase
VYVIHNAVDHGVFNPPDRLARREVTRHQLELPNDDFALLLVGNDWKKKGLHWLLEAIGRLRHLAVRLLVVGRDDLTPFDPLIRKLKISQHVRLVGSSSDILKFYAACDVYVGPSLHDSFAFPPLEAMACGLPVITSSQNGGCEIITNGVDGFILDDPRDSSKLADLILLLYNDKGLRQRIEEAAAKTAQQYTWDRNAQQLDQLFREVLRRKGLSPAAVAAEPLAR